jgi:hypothetical protein
MSILVRNAACLRDTMAVFWHVKIDYASWLFQMFQMGHMILLALAGHTEDNLLPSVFSYSWIVYYDCISICRELTLAALFMR